MTRIRRRRGDALAEPGRADEPARAAPFTPAWASALGNQRVARLAAEYSEEPDEDGADTGELAALIAGLVEALAGADQAADATSPPTEPQLATLARSPVARNPTTPPVNRTDVADLKRVGTRTLRELDKLEKERAITTTEAEKSRESIRNLMAATTVGKGDHRKLQKMLDGMRAMPAWARRRAEASRSTKGKKLVTSFKAEPPVIRVDQHEATRVSFVVKGTPQHINAYILSDPQAEGTSYRFFNLEAKEGLHQLLWDGTFEGTRNQPPESGVFRLMIEITGADGKTESLAEEIRVVNPDNETVLPRVASGLPIRELHFDGRMFVLTDEGGNTIEAPATSGLKPNNPHNPDHKDYTGPEHEWEKGRGPIPHGNYTVSPGQFQVPDADPRGTKYITGGTAHGWGPMRVHILPNVVKNRSEFFLHMDVTDDGTAGCIGFPSSQGGKFNQIMSLIATNKKDVKLVVEY